ncbi:hypothetical protein [Patiriisocius hiemis]|uniref:Uncharacterized protein n=1 Tax=Patiriisocius hiemis TaxID=3075604 RepID=A0ABU2YFE9_9FLAO|nr:hypothetical protein [Constantimarinum sp. W242]MDT0555778.1 hypothetical protein [Constantimarinum sp. W242]
MDNEDKFPIEGSLGILAFGDIAFEKWREVKIANNIFNEEEYRVQNEEE